MAADGDAMKNKYNQWALDLTLTLLSADKDNGAWGLDVDNNPEHRKYMKAVDRLIERLQRQITTEVVWPDSRSEGK